MSAQFDLEQDILRCWNVTDDIGEVLDDLEFIKNARTELFMGLKVFYNSSW